MENSKKLVWKLNKFRFEDVFFFFSECGKSLERESDLRGLIGQRPNAFDWWIFVFAVAATAVATVSPFFVRSDRLEM